MEEKTKNLKEKITELRRIVAEAELKQTGLNKYAGFKYYQLEDFLPTVNKLCDRIGLFPSFSILNYTDHVWDKEKREYYEVTKNMARLRIKDTEGNEFEDFEIPVAEVRMGGKDRNPIQELGAANTYLKRYLYMNFLELSEGDAVDATIGKENKPTYKMLKDFGDAYEDDERRKIRSYYKVETDEEIPKEAMKKYIANKKDKLAEKRKAEALDVNAPLKDFY